MIQEKLQYVETYYGVRIVGIASNLSGKSKKTCKDLAILRLDLVIMPCYAHQVCCYIKK
jgi:hypothetical protein